jgi:hypothetical protein
MAINPWPRKAATEIAAKAAALGLQAASGVEELSFTDFVQKFSNGFDIYWSLDSGAREVHGEIKRKYDMWGGGTGFLGMPQTDELGTPDGFGRFNHFGNGSIYWTPHTGPMTVSGPIRDVWATLGWERGFLGYPITDQIRWRTPNPGADYFIAWNLFENGAVVTTKATPGGAGQAATASITPDRLKYLVHRAVDVAVHQLPDNIGLYPDVEITGVSEYEYDFMRSRSRAVTFKLHGFHDNGVLGDTEFHFWFALRFGLSEDPESFVDPQFRSLTAELIPGSVGIDVEGISGWFVDGNDYKQKIEDGFLQRASVGGTFPVTTKPSPDSPVPEADVKLIIIDVMVTVEGGLDFLVNPEPVLPGVGGSYVVLVQQKVDDFVANF